MFVLSIYVTTTIFVLTNNYFRILTSFIYIFYRKVKKKYKQHFRSTWKLDYDWLKNKEFSDKTGSFCTVCQHGIEGSKYHLDRHASTLAHKRNYQKVKGVPKIKSCIEKDKTSPVENKIVMFLVQHNISFNSLDHLTKLIKSVAIKENLSEINKLKCSRTKATKIVVDRFGPKQQAGLVEKLKKVKFSILIDETTDVSSTKSLAVMVRYFENGVKTSFLCLIDVPQATADVIFELIKKKLADWEIPMTNVIGFGADNAAVMIGIRNGVYAKFKSELPHIFGMGCICHSIDLCSSAASATLPSTIEQFVHDVYNHFAHSAKRKHNYEKYQEMHNVVKHAILRPCDTRWLSLDVSFCD